MAQDPLALFAKHWRTRQSQAQQLGFPAQFVAQVAHYDGQRMAKGAAPLTDAQALHGIATLAQGHPATPLPHPSLSPTAFVGNARDDLSQILRGLIHVPGQLLKEVESIPKIPTELAQATKAHDPGELLRNLGHVHMLHLLPGLTTAGELTTAQGREQLYTHPVSTLLDVWPAAHFSFNHLIGEAGREALAGAVPTPIKESLTAFKANWQKVMEGIGMGRSDRDVAQIVNVGQRHTAHDVGAMAKVGDFFRSEGLAAFYEGLNREEQAQIAHLMREGHPSEIAAAPPEWQSFIGHARVVQERVNTQAENLGAMAVVHIPGIGTQWYVLGEAARAGKAMTRIERLLGARASVSEQLSQAQEALKTDLEGPAAIARIRAAKESLETIHGRLLEQAIKVVPEAFKGLVSDQVRHSIEAAVPQGEFEAVMDSIYNKSFDHGLSAAEYDKIVKDAKIGWLAAAANGVHPLIVHDAGFGKALGLFNREAARPLLDAAPGTGDLQVLLAKSQMDAVERAGREAIPRELAPFLHSRADVLSEARAKGDLPAPTELAVETHRAAADGYLRRQGLVTFDPHIPGLEGLGEQLIPQHLQKVLDQLLDPKLGGPKGSLAGLYDKGLKVFRMSILPFSPRFYVHTIVSGLALVLGRADPMVGRFLGDAFRAVKEGTGPDFLPTGALTIPKEDQLWKVASGYSMGRLFGEAQGADPSAMRKFGSAVGGKITGVADKMFKFHAFVADMERVAAYLWEKEKAMGRGLPSDTTRLPGALPRKGTAEDAGMRFSNKVMSNWDRMTPVERTIIRNVFPFYGWMSHLLRYTFSYPFDHPYRAAILTRFAENELQDWNKTLPQSMMQLMFLGKPDYLGNTQAIDVRAANPLRDVANYFTLGGFLSAMTPLSQGFLSSIGIRYGGNIDLHPQLTVDPVSGQLVPIHQDPLPKFMESFIPPLQTIDGLLGWSSDMRSLRQANPEAFRHRLFLALGIPWVPQNLNLPEKAVQAESHRETAASDALRHAIRSGDWSLVLRYDRVPLGKSTYDPHVLRRLVEGLQKRQKSRPGEPPVSTSQLSQALRASQGSRRTS